ncbi:membrane protein / vitamin k-dependent gamma-carboxylase [Paenibacillus alvei TS-15]|uniref:Membrane protein / vitamin k-dependent gamma-carboxylase n=1 Tax=Paenibacillus alvei TS-15 TaxID=1117108 RepID=S9SW63_PAEAL|nr:HTTM domain-containing protein [Paenibacillus alvei]EPY08904.1 membrane protein / vitamin k-dependent gamma-carboxylase [Paenibacillus alvei TS-15]
MRFSKANTLKRIDNALNWISIPRHLKGLMYARVSLGVIMLYIYSINYGQRYFLFGPNGAYTKTPAFSLFHVSDPLIFDVLYHSAILAALCFTIGFGGRFMTLINFLFFWSWTSVSILIGDGGDNLLRVMFPYLLLTDLYGKLKPNTTTLTTKILSTLHNFGLAAIIVQLCFVYLTAGLMKVQGGMWLDGTALYYILQVDEFSNPFLSGLIINSPGLSVIGSYATVFFQLGFPFLILHPRIKPFVIGMSILLHLGIWLFMNLPSFSWVMIAFELPFLSDAEYQKMISYLKSPLVSLKRKMEKSSADEKTLQNNV